MSHRFLPSLAATVLFSTILTPITQAQPPEPRSLEPTVAATPEPTFAVPPKATPTAAPKPEFFAPQQLAPETGPMLLPQAASSQPSIEVRINTASNSSSINVGQTVDCEIWISGASSDEVGTVPVTMWCSDDRGGTIPPDKFAFEGGGSGNQLHPALARNGTRFPFRITGVHGGTSTLQVRLGAVYDNSKPHLATVTFKVVPGVSKIQVKTGSSWADWGETHNVLKGRRVTLKAVPSSGSWPTGYPMWNASSGVSAARQSDGTCIVEYQARSASIAEADNKNVNAYALTSNKVARAVVGEIGLDQVDFANNRHMLKDDGSGDYPHMEWESEQTMATASPLLYSGGQKLKAQSYFWVLPAGFNAAGIKVQGKATGTAINGTANFTFPSQGLLQQGGDTFYPSREATTAMATSSNIFQPLRVSWQVQVNSTWRELAASVNKLYRTWKPPVAGTPLFHTVVDVACRNTRGVSGANTIASKIWYGVFETRVVPAADGQPTSGMTYWKTKTNPSFETKELVASQDGRCGAWEDFFQDVLKTQGAEVYNGFFGVTIWPPKPPAYCVSIPTPEGKYVGHYQNNNAGYDFYNAIEVPATAPAQGGAPAQNWFNNHAIVKKNSFVYDPSYGRLIDSQVNWEGQSINRYVWLRLGVTGLYVHAQFPNVAGTQETRWISD